MVAVTGRWPVASQQKFGVGFIQKSVSNTLTATAGGTKALALPLTSAKNRLSVCATNGDSVLLPAVSPADVGIEVEIINDGAANAQVFGQGSDTIDAIATATGVVLSATKRATYSLISHSGTVGAWTSNMGIPSA